ncbi:uncharacterized protein LOC124275271 [Haliotis rubra]|uniref:uncharacterized protein LOC124275271 n=1 Tax=Haliotis rubra TaxID=36100 RepID=UPI001EE5C0F3|nr:uncharacterized protein LOC124275271 [Haliotis rubra]
MALLPPGGLPEIVFSFDTTGSMSSCLAEVRGRLQDMIQRLQADIPAIRMAVFAHGDYSTASTYVTKWIDFSTDIKELCDFDLNVDDGGRHLKLDNFTNIFDLLMAICYREHGADILHKPSKFVTPLLRREEVFENNFSLRDMDWSHWVKVISPDLPLKQNAQWEKRRGANPGFKRRTVFKFKNNKPAFYEISVQTIKYGRRCVVFSMFGHHIPNNVNWETQLLGNKLVRAQVNNVVSQNCSVFVRRVVYRRASAHVQAAAMMKSYTTLGGAYHHDPLLDMFTNKEAQFHQIKYRMFLNID